MITKTKLWKQIQAGFKEFKRSEIIKQEIMKKVKKSEQKED